jgi:hypothetical protein
MPFTDEDKNWIAALFRTNEERTAALFRATEERIEHVETALLTEFHKWASPMEMRVKSHSLTLRALDLEVEALNERVTRLEPPQ